MYEDSKISESITSSWEKTDEPGTNFLMFTLIFMSLILISALVLGSIIPAGIAQIFILSITEYIFIIPLGYIFFNLYNSLKTL